MRERKVFAWIGSNGNSFTMEQPAPTSAQRPCVSDTSSLNAYNLLPTSAQRPQVLQFFSDSSDQPRSCSQLAPTSAQRPRASNEMSSSSGQSPASSPAVHPAPIILLSTSSSQPVTTYALEPPRELSLFPSSSVDPQTPYDADELNQPTTASNNPTSNNLHENSS